MRIRKPNIDIRPLREIPPGKPFRFSPDTGYLYMRLTKGYCKVSTGEYYGNLHSMHPNLAHIVDAEILEN